MKPVINYVLDILMLIAFVITALTSLVIKNRELHNLFGKIFIALVIFHILLHWKWIFSMTKNLFKSNSTQN